MKLTTSDIQSLLEIARRASDAILGVYESEDFNVEIKGDGSPLTRADRLAHEQIVSGLRELTPDVPILSEESKEIPYDERRDWQTFWLVDPLDGTKEFVKRNGEFTVNIALIDHGQPVFGVVHAPVLDTVYYGGPEAGAWKGVRAEPPLALKTKPFQDSAPLTVVASRSHRGEAVDAFLASLANSHGEAEVSSMGSSLKICLVAEGQADIYPRLGPTSEWDTAAAHAVVLGAGGVVTNSEGDSLAYNKANVLNPWFLVIGDATYDWKQHVPQPTA